MMIYGVGTDIVNIKRLEKNEELLNRFIRRSLSEAEQQQMVRKGLADFAARVAYVARRFAAKEAVVKALGTGFRDGIYLADIEIISDGLGKPLVELKGQARERLKQIAGGRHAAVHLSLSDDYPFAQAFAVIEV